MITNCETMYNVGDTIQFSINWFNEPVSAMVVGIKIETFVTASRKVEHVVYYSTKEYGMIRESSVTPTPKFQTK